MPHYTANENPVSSKSWSSNSLINTLLMEWLPGTTNYWSNSTISYSFPFTRELFSAANESGDQWGLELLNDTQRAQIRKAFAAWDEVIAPSFVEITESKDTGLVGDLRVYLTNAVGSEAWGWATYPFQQGADSGDIRISPVYARNSDFKESGKDNYDFTAMLHEIGHAIGLEHPFEGVTRLSSELDNRSNTIMSYTDYAPHGYAWASTPMVYDIQAAQYLYGADLTTRTGDDIYIFNDGETLIKTIWDAGGNDTMDASQFTSGITMRLDDGSYSNIGMQDNIAIAINAVIENAIGGGGDDTIEGNESNNRLVGNEGADRLLGQSGNDTLLGGSGWDWLDGGSGTDTAEYSQSRRDVRLSIDSKGTWTADSGDGADILVSIEQLRVGNGELITLPSNLGGELNGLGYRIDTLAGQNAGMAYRIYQAAFDRTPDLGGLSYWLGALDKGMDLIEMSARFIDSNEFRTLYGNNPDTRSYVEKLYRNVLNRDGETGGITFWVGELDSGSKSRAKVLADFAESTENVNLVGVLINNGYGYDQNSYALA
ncbi:DUF4214 domain-containing protein [Chitinilyticum litopenaei]|uniref:DUF4214 domain-containing protein n=1 Tax=Chitinilyticum litopenaei TaxID=1121276 RepID=UPI00040B783D|nr:DUF4214 domain-containing protein [Chitinilyticum litopenaei]